MLPLAIAFTLFSPPYQTLEGKAVDPLAFSAGKASVWVFVGTECPISNAYAPELNRLSKEFTSKGVQIFLVYSDPSTKKDDALQHWQSFHLAAPGLLDPKQTLMHRAGATKTPEVAVFTSQGALVYRGRIDDRFASLGVGRSTPKKRDLHNVLSSVLAGRKGKFPFRDSVGCYIPAL